MAHYTILVMTKLRIFSCNIIIFCLKIVKGIVNRRALPVKIEYYSLLILELQYEDNLTLTIIYIETKVLYVFS